MSSGGREEEVDGAILGRHKLTILKKTLKLEHDIKIHRKNGQVRVFFFKMQIGTVNCLQNI